MQGYFGFAIFSGIALLAVMPTLAALLSRRASVVLWALGLPTLGLVLVIGYALALGAIAMRDLFWVGIFVGIAVVVPAPMIVALARDVPTAPRAYILGWVFGLPVLGWFVALWYALTEPAARGAR